MQNLLFVELLGGIGDVLIALPAIQALGRSYPNAKKTVLTFAPGGELLKHDPLIDRVITINRNQNHDSESIRQQVEQWIKLGSFDLIVSDTNYGGIDSAIQESGAQKVVTNLWRSPPPNQRVGDRFIQILLAEGVIQSESVSPAQLYLTHDELHHAQQKLGSVNHPCVLLIPDAGMAIKRWSTANFVTLGRKLHHQYGATIIVPVGSDRPSATEMVQQIGGSARLWERGTLRELAALMAMVDLAIAPDTGPARVAAALNTPTITLFGPSWGDRYGQRPPHINLQGHPGCPDRNISNFTLQRCWYSGECPFDGWQTCLEAISPEDVRAAAAKFLKPPTQGSQPPGSNLPARLSNPTYSPSNLQLSPSNPESFASNRETPTSKLNPSTSELETPTSDLQASTSELETPTSDLETSTSELETLPSDLQASTSELEISPSDLETSLSNLQTSPSNLQTPPSELKTQNSKLKTSHPSPQWLSAQNILVIRLDNIGDVLMTSPALQAIKQNLPQSRLTLMASPGGSQAAELLPWVDEVLPVRSLWQDLGKLEFDPDREWDLIKTVRDRQFDAAIVFTSFSQTPHAAGYLCYLAGIPLRVGESKEWGGAVFSTEIKSAPDEIHQVERNLRLIESVGFRVGDRSLRLRIPESAHQRATEKLAKHRLDSPYILLNPWTSCQSRNYSSERFAIAARQLAAITGYSVVVTGVAKDLHYSESLLESLGSCAINLIGETNLAELAALIANAKLMLSNNTSTMHIADATRTPSVILFAGTEYECQWQPRHTAAKLLRQPTPCSPCYAFTCPYNLECLDIAPKQVVEVGLSLLHNLLC
ncbi:hypothetical protein K9N68_00455 [Kovacikia minuta CCNUW1]|uniref:glycosyltransferase family 9 protein n=1 Tax=Kovacikia minuta TaxID=2931930 RepID=UPI001CCBE841|nr:glycosyltransferase family 9 protein [Kovacikia minuta]UBF26519.1 hypothetical protein K9N68_00455 [Kovacikia minuta CCNUW1]